MKTVINVIENDILSLTGYDAIVNSTNVQLKTLLLGGSSLDKKIHSIAGQDLEEECKKIREAGGCNICEAVTTGAYQLPYQHIIHVVVPDAKKDGTSWWEYGQCYYSVLSAAMDNADKKIALPLLVPKKHSYSAKEAAEYAVKSVQEFCRAYPEAFEQITFVIKENPELADYIRNLISNSARVTYEIVSLMMDIKNVNIKGLEEVAPKIVVNMINKVRCISLISFLPMRKLILKVLKRVLDLENMEGTIAIEKDRVTMKLPLYGQAVNICCRQLAIRKQGDKMKLVIDIDKINLDAVIDLLADYNFNVESGDKSAQLLNCILKSVNASTEGNKKYELIQCLFDWLNSTSLVNDVIHNVAEQEGGKIKELIEAMELEVGDIKLLI